MDFITDNLPEIVQLATMIVGVFALIATMTPNQADNKIADALLTAVNWLGANFGKAKNG